jgi:hypothetical protein
LGSFAEAARLVSSSRRTIAMLRAEGLLSARDERKLYGLPEDQVSWWEIIRLDGHRRLRKHPRSSSKPLLAGMVYRFSLERFLIGYEVGSLPIIVAANRATGYVLDRKRAGLYDPTDMLRQLGLRWRPATRRSRANTIGDAPHVHDSSPPRARHQPSQPSSRTGQRSLFDT